MPAIHLSKPTFDSAIAAVVLALNRSIAELNKVISVLLATSSTDGKTAHAANIAFSPDAPASTNAS